MKSFPIRQKGGSEAWIIIDAAAACLFWLYLDSALYSITSSQVIASLDVSASPLALPVGNIIAIIIIGLLSNLVGSNIKGLFKIGVLSVLLCGLLKIILLFATHAALVFVYAVVTFCVCFLLVLAWCERIAQKQGAEKIKFLILFCAIEILLFFINANYNIVGVIPFPELLAIVSAVFCLLAPENQKSGNDKPKNMPAFILVVLFLFGTLTGVMSFEITRLPEAAGGGLAPSNLVADYWHVIMLGIVMALVVFVGLWRRTLSPALLTLIPLTSFGLLVLPLLSGRPYELFAGLMSLCNICIVVIWSIGPAHSKKSFALGSFEFVFWKRSWMQIGLMVGFCAMSLFPAFVPEDNNALLAHFSAYAVAILTASTVLGYANEKKMWGNSAQNDWQSTLLSLAREHGLTEREKEVFLLLAQGRSLPWIQKKLNIASGTASTHCSHIYQKIGIHSKQELLDLLDSVRRGSED